MNRWLGSSDRNRRHANAVWLIYCSNLKCVGLVCIPHWSLDMHGNEERTDETSTPEKQMCARQPHRQRRTQRPTLARRTKTALWSGPYGMRAWCSPLNECLQSVRLCMYTGPFSHPALILIHSTRTHAPRKGKATPWKSPFLPLLEFYNAYRTENVSINDVEKNATH